jgi:hypothetical protein
LEVVWEKTEELVPNRTNSAAVKAKELTALRPFFWERDDFIDVYLNKDAI